MADNYISTNMESGVKVKEALERIESYEPGLFVWTEVSDSVTVNLKSPTTYSGIKDPGDYVIYKFSNGPAKIPSTLAPVLLSLRNGEICVTANNMVFMLNGDNWVDMSESTDTDTTIFVKSDIAPVRTKNCYWFDTSKYATEGYITLKYYDTDTSTWTSVFNEERYLKKSELDPDNKNTDVYDYITTKVADVVGEYGEFMKHVANQLTYIHVSADDRKAYGKIITKDQLQTLLEKTYTPAVKTVIDQTVSDGLGTTALENSLTTLKDNITSHLEGHVTAEDITRWKNKAEKNHTHDYTQGNTKLDASQIVSGTFGEDQLPDEIKERYYKITAASPAAEFSSSSITAAMRKGKYHNGNGFYFETTDGTTGKVNRQWYRIIDSSKIGTSNWAQGVVDFTATEVNLDWNQISGKPSSLEEFGITTDLYTKTEVNEKFSSYDSNITELNKNLETANEEVSYEFGVKDTYSTLEKINEETISDDTSIDYKLGIHKSIIMNNIWYAFDEDAYMYSTDGINWTEGTLPIWLNWLSGCYGNDIYVIIGLATSSISSYIYSTDGINWTEGTLPSKQKWRSVCYGNGKFVAVANDTDVYAYSTDGINWTQGNLPSSQVWGDICYGNSTFVAISVVSWGSNVYAYSTDGINWTEGTLPSKQYWLSVCYGNGKFVTISYDSNVAYSTDGINWTEGTLPSSRYWNALYYMNNKFIALPKLTEINGNDFVVQSTDGINWEINEFDSKYGLKFMIYFNHKYYIYGSPNRINPA